MKKFRWVRHLNNQKGYNMLELVIVMCVMALLMAGAYLAYTEYVKTANITRATDDCNQIARGIQMYTATTGKQFGTTAFPATDAGLNDALFKEFTGQNGQKYQPLLGSQSWTAFGTDVKDPWGRAYRYTTAAPYQIISDGPDLTAGTTDDIKIRFQ